MSQRTRDFAHPFTPAEVLARKAAARKVVDDAQPSRNGQQDVSDAEALGTFTAFGLVLALLGTGLCWWRGWPLWAGSVPSVLLVSGVVWLCVGYHRRVARAKSDLRATQAEIDRRWKVRAPLPVAEQVATVINGINALPAEARAEFAPVMDAVNDCCVLLRENPNDRDARARIVARAEAVKRAVAQVSALEEEMRQQEFSLRYRSNDDTDLVTVTSFTEAIEAARMAVSAAGARGPLVSR